MGELAHRKSKRAKDGSQLSIQNNQEGAMAVHDLKLIQEELARLLKIYSQEFRANERILIAERIEQLFQLIQMTN